MRRRGLLVLLAGLAGCTTPESGDGPGAGRTDRPVTTARGTETTRGTGTTTRETETTTRGSGTATTGTGTAAGTTGERSPAGCSRARVTFRLPVETRPDPLDGASARRVAVEVERAHVESLSVGPELFPQVPDDADSLSFSPGGPDDADVRPIEGGYEVVVRGRVEYVLPGRGTPDGGSRSVDLAVYRVTERALVRVRGVGDVSGPVICW